MAWEQLSINKPHLVYIILGGFTSIFMLCSLFIKEKLYIGEATVATIVGVIFGPHAANLINPLSWGNTDQITLEFSRIVLVVQCFAVGVELPKAYMERHWRSVFFLLVPVMTFGWLMTSLFVWWLIVPLTWLESLVVAACVTATDPVLASSVVGKGKFAKRVPKHLRDVLSAESGCNDGMAFPFIYLSLYLLRYDLHGKEVVFHWVCFTILYECVFGAVYGVCVGYIGRHAIKLAERKGLIDRESFLVFYFVLALFCAGSGSLLGMDDLLIGFAAGVGFSNDGWFTEKTEESHVSNVIDLLLNLAYFVYLGTIVPWDQYNSPEHGLVPWRLVAISILVIFFRRIPAMLALKTIIPDVKTWREALFAGHFGPIGVGAIFAAILARAELETDSTTPLAILPAPGSKDYELIYLVWPVVTFLVISSILVHGSSIAVFTLGKRINTLTITLSYTTDNEKGPAWMNRLPRISSQSRSMSKMDSADLSDIENGIPKLQLRRQKEDDDEKSTFSRPGSRSSSLRPSRRRRRRDRDTGLGPGGPISESAIKPAPRSDTNLLSMESGSETLNEKSSEPSPEGQQAQSAPESPERQPLDAEGEGEGEDRHRTRSPSPGTSAQVEAYEEGEELIIEDEEGNVLDTVEVEGMSKEEKAKKIEDSRRKLEKDKSGEYAKHKHEPHPGPTEGEELEHEVEGNLEEDTPGPTDQGKKFRKRFDQWKGFGRKEEESQPKKAKPESQKKRGPAHAYQFGNTVIVEDEDGEVIKKYTLPASERTGDRRKYLGEAQMRQGLQRMGSLFHKPGVPVQGEASSSTEPINDGQEEDQDFKPQKPKRQETTRRKSTDSEDDGLRMTISRADRYGLTGLQKKRQEDEDVIALGSGRRMSTKDFIRQMQQLDPKSKIQEVNDSNAPDDVKQELKFEALVQQQGGKPSTLKTDAGADDVGATASQRPSMGRRAISDQPLAPEERQTLQRPQAYRNDTTETVESLASIEEDVPVHDIRSSIIRYGKGQTSADQRRQRLASIRSDDEEDSAEENETPAERRRRLAALGHSADDESEQTETAAERRRRLAALTHSTEDDDENEEGETAAEKRRRLAALGHTHDEDSSESEDDDSPRVPRVAVPEPAHPAPVRRIQWGGESGRERPAEPEAEESSSKPGMGRKVRGLFKSK